MEAAWFTALFSAICLEGLGRRYLPFIPSFAFYFLKDLVLLVGYLLFRPAPGVKRIVSHLYRGFGLFWIVGFVWTVIEVFNPHQSSAVLALVGLRAYWLWWFAPAVLAQVLSKERNKRHAIYVFLVMSIAIAVLAALQFAAPANSALNLYTVQNGEDIYAADVATIGTTGRARVASTFSFLAGFQDFTILVPALLLALGLEAKQGRFRNAAFLGTFATAAVLPMSGSRSGVILGVAVLAITAWISGLFFTRVGRRVLIGGIVAAVLSVTMFPDAILGVRDRFQDADETHGRYLDAVEAFVPPMAIARTEGPFLGIGTGMQQNARAIMHIDVDWNQELETGRYLVELGPIGFLVIWVAKVGLMVALFRAALILKRAGRRGAAAAATSYAVMIFSGNLTFDHVWEALYFLGCGFILAEVVSVSRAAAVSAAAAAARAAAVAPAAPATAPARLLI